MKIFSTDSVKMIEGILHISIQDTSSGQMVIDKEWKVSHQVLDSTDGGNQYLIGVIGFVVPHSGYKCVIGGRDSKEDKNQRNYTEYITSNHFIAEIFRLVIFSLHQELSRIAPTQHLFFIKTAWKFFYTKLCIW